VLGDLDTALVTVQSALLAQAEKHREAAMPGYTHLQRAQPVLLAHHLLAYVAMLDRDRERFADCGRRVNIMPLGSAALAGAAFVIDREALARDLGFAAPSSNSMDAVADRDYVVEFLAAAAVLGMHCSRLAADLTLWATSEFGFVEFADAFATGSSIMPQKKNPDVAELIRGKTGRLYGNLMAVLTVMKGLPLTYNSDMQEDKEPLFDTVDTLEAVLRVLPPMLESLTFRVDRMLHAAGAFYSTATDLADYLVRKGLPFARRTRSWAARCARASPGARSWGALPGRAQALLAPHREGRLRGAQRRVVAPRAGRDRRYRSRCGGPRHRAGPGPRGEGPQAVIRPSRGAVVATGIAMAALALAGCGKKGPIVPPERRLPVAPAEMTATVEDRAIVVKWTNPRNRVDNTGSGIWPWRGSSDAKRHRAPSPSRPCYPAIAWSATSGSRRSRSTPRHLLECSGRRSRHVHRRQGA
jgi:predicted small lipoprotein YifL